MKESSISEGVTRAFSGPNKERIGGVMKEMIKESLVSYDQRDYLTAP
jgi:hypothetical protein